MTDNLHCPRCTLSHIKLNGHTHYGVQNHQCLECGRQFVEQRDTISHQQKGLIEKLLLERKHLRGICRVLDVRMTSLLGFMEELYAHSPDDINVILPNGRASVELLCLEVEAD
jgi:transposase-like protein